MPEALDYLLCAVLIGAGATSVMDFWAAARTWLLGIPPLDYGLVGRWLAHLVRDAAKAKGCKVSGDGFDICGVRFSLTA